ncbi:hypothetical protein TTHERM_001004918 (macronuclear) [Tetrahymena thermophila SB210]|uniref:Uncharacterized protein n=1 Tax=Tetrahymena thermophila (strain SB210) TaxID=312017 RepID=W7XG17_TETTS|nr:hypothetical protein TTHERM_001004918 [Tetrahymena thermophila SB210]EWS75838.1 hypothetical protein TTHERM_001004918 [Tetrahymena thermophila SB210]|eukprot:XP_012651621.1 hypothetical protein TTHERM_001004918 [Tetrahymena thermophila SB210]
MERFFQVMDALMDNIKLHLALNQFFLINFINLEILTVARIQKLKIAILILFSKVEIYIMMLIKIREVFHTTAVQNIGPSVKLNFQAGCVYLKIFHIIV